MNQIPPLMNVFRQAEEESEWKRMLLRNSLHQFLLSNVDFLNSFSLCNVINGQNVLPPNLTNDLINQNFSLTHNSSFQDETLFSLIQNINDSLLQLFNYYQDILQQNPATALNPNPLSFLPFNVQPRISFNVLVKILKSLLKFAFRPILCKICSTQIGKIIMPIGSI